MNILLTGGAGLIGMAARDVLASAGHTVTAIDVTDFGRGDTGLTLMGLDDRASLEALITNNRIDAIVHCGAISGPMMAKGEPLKIVTVNIDTTALLLDLARLHNMKRFVFCSSISVYGDAGRMVINEETQLHPTSVYGASKVACEQLVEGFAVEYGLEGVSLRIGRVYGPYRRANCFLADIIRDAQAGKATVIPCDPEFTYHYVHADDVAEAIAAVLVAPHFKRRSYNVGAGEPLTMPEIAAIAEAVIAGAKVELVSGADDVPDVQTDFDVSRIGQDIGWKPKLPLATGLAAYRQAILSGRSA
ncbi:NAD-dependent epimerase/dehydratase family protein [Rhizobium johnstonii]|uniref:NAD-dependent epimerase/dehydratase family protein n=1 Tax=Rhizobium TaxID=379 RepID=UPI0010303FD6|nr:NAD(P)-dependent oxidoreductase [Rhizobium leguminosarum]TBF70824.1 NAD(P)-dependent oxidoreductase [Rhizobium leguminosarum]TBG93307.1 NAD(P)-dependent oxidoreductase [Rhizobium leguminosarum]TBG98709.1 NAD(P)-dependent oxidoreductase [Rhizobium leguminosarum]TBH29922.1 NAD(P)-dependent oxidoreductase [Rhizobium leguminosarum]TBH59601.1 NAD(P)-dependent oxidoreductase [Rhizobium leguminosarum]